jgi:hypothetical protein
LRRRQAAPSYETYGEIVADGEDCSSVLVQVALGQVGGFLLKSAEAETGYARVRGYEMAILEQQGLRGVE